jgi:hypothetical protein
MVQGVLELRERRRPPFGTVGRGAPKERTHVMAPPHVVLEPPQVAGTPAGIRPVVLDRRGPAFQAFVALYLGFVVAPLVAGADKFFDKLTNWDQYLAPQIAKILPVAPHTFMQIVGVIEVIAGLLVLVRPKIGAYVVSAWLLGIIVDLLLSGQYFDIALRDLGLALGAFALGRLALLFDTPWSARGTSPVRA